MVAETNAENPPQDPRLELCREPTCRAKIIKLPTRNGSKMPCDADTVGYNDVLYDPERGGHVSHFKTCRNPNRFSRGGRR